MKQEFTDYIKEHIKDYLPDDYADAAVTIETVVKNNNREQTGIFIHRPDESIAPTIYLERFEAEHENGRPMDEITERISQMYLRTSVEYEFNQDCLTDYEKAKPLLEIFLCDPEINGKYLVNKVYTPCGAFAAVYQLRILQTDDGVGSVGITPDIMENWGVSLEDLHRDAVAAEIGREPAMLCDMSDLIASAFSGDPTENLLDEPEPEIEGIAMFALTNDSRVNGASVIARDGLLDRIGDILGRDYFILPSSIHEVLLIPDNGFVKWADISKMVKEVNNTQVQLKDILSYKVQRYNRTEHILQQAPMAAAV